MFLLVFGLVLWIGAHSFQRLLPDARGRLGARGKGPVALILLLSVVLMVLGYRGADFVSIYSPLPGMGHLNNLLMLFAIFLLGAGSAKGKIASKIRHPMLSGAVVWAIAHLLVNGDLASVILFTGLGLWAVGQMIMINRAEGPWTKPVPGPWTKDLRVLAIAVVLYGAIAGIHIWLGHNPFLGTYG